MKAPLRVGILAVEHCTISGIASAVDAFSFAETLARIRAPEAEPLFEVTVFSANGADTVMTSSGMPVGCAPAVPEALDVVLVPGIMHASAVELDARTRKMKAEIELLCALHARGVTVAAGCAGTWLLAHTGLLDGRRATTSWWLGPAFLRRFPSVVLDAEAIVAEQDGLLTGGAASAMLDVVLQLVERAGGAELAQQTSRILLVDTQRQSQTPWVDLALIQRPRHSLTERAVRFLTENLHRDVGVAELAVHCGVSERTLLRHFHTHFGCTPHAHLQQMRVERAKALLESTLLTFDEIVEHCGYSDVSSFRKLFKRRTARTPGDYRERFRLRAH